MSESENEEPIPSVTSKRWSVKRREKARSGTRATDGFPRSEFLAPVCSVAHAPVSAAGRIRAGK